MDITPELKDKLLNYFHQKDSIKFVFSIQENANEVGIDENLLLLIFNQFVDYNLVKKEQIASRNIYFVSLTANFFDMLHHGGFVGQEELLLHNINKLLLEIEIFKKELAPDKLDMANKIAAIGGAIASGLALFK